MRGLLVVAAVVCVAGVAHADSSKLSKEEVSVSAKGIAPAKNKLCCGYPLSEPQGFKMTYYWMARQQRHIDRLDAGESSLYTRSGFFLGTFNNSFVRALRMEGSGWLWDGTVLNYAGRCNYGVGTCFDILDRQTHPYGRGARRWPLEPFRSIAVDRRLIPLGDPVYVPELDGVTMPDGRVHDGCVRADDTGGMIKQRKIDFFVVTYEGYRNVNDTLWGLGKISPQIEHPRCEYLRRN
jgi:3D (Asp-Asp-Asp) domain-containing protein